MSDNGNKEFFRFTSTVLCLGGYWPLQPDRIFWRIKWKNVYLFPIHLVYLLLTFLLEGYMVYLFPLKVDGLSVIKLCSEVPILIQLAMRRERFRDLLKTLFKWFEEDKKSTFMSTFGKEVKRTNIISLFCIVSIDTIKLTRIILSLKMVYLIYVDNPYDLARMSIWNYAVLMRVFYTPISTLIGHLRLLQQLLAFHSSCSHIALRFRKITASLANLNLISQKSIPSNQPKSCKFRRTFLNILHAHNEAMATVPRMMDIFSVGIMVSLTFAAIQIAQECVILGLAAYSWTISVGNILVRLIVIYIYTSGGTNLFESSISLSTAAYELKWYEWNTRHMKSILMIMRQSQNGIILKVFGWTVSLETCTMILFAVESYISFMQFSFNRKIVYIN